MLIIIVIILMHALLQIIIGIIIADFLSGVFHWFEDTYIDYCTTIPALSNIAKDNELHHYFPRAMLSHTYLENMAVTLPLTGFSIVLIYLYNKDFVIKYIYMFITLFIFASTANVFHRFSHMRNCELPPIIKWLQYNKIIISHKDHSHHHTTSIDSYCTVIPYTNYILDKIEFWRFLEYCIYICTLTIVKPRPKKTYNEYNDIQNYMHIDNKQECPKKPTKLDVDILKQNLKNYYKCDLKD